MSNDKQFWASRYASTVGLKTVGCWSKNETDNARDYDLGAKRFREYLAADIPRTQRASAMELGFGRGFYTRILHDEGFQHCIAYDIANPKGPELGPSFKFLLGDAGVPIQGKPTRDLVMAIDVLFHITDE